MELNSIKYDNFIRNDLGILLEDEQLNIHRVMWYQHDRCPAHYGRRVTATLNEIFPNRWIGHNGPISWPARSSDITPLDFFLWRTLKNIVYQKADHTEKYEATNYCNMCDNQSASVKKCTGIDCSVALMQTDITSNTFDVRIIVLFLYLMTNDFLS